MSYLCTLNVFRPGNQKRTLLKELNDNPGPGTHESNKSQLAGTKWGFGSSAKLPRKDDKLPGPGSYFIPVQVGNVPSYSMPNRDASFKFT